jgi:hypothetical protein
MIGAENPLPVGKNPLDANGKIAEATSAPGPVFACLGEVIAKGALY